MYNTRMPGLAQSVVRFVAITIVIGAVVAPVARGQQGPVVLQPGLGAPGGGTVPSIGYDLAFTALAAGDYSSAAEIAGREYQGGIKAGDTRWIDSIANATAFGESQYELGNLRQAVAAYEDALLLASAHPDWLLAVQFPSQPLRPLAKARVATWGRSTRGTAPAQLPDTMSIRQGGADPNQVLQRGGVLTAPVNYPIRPQEIVRSIAIAAYRHASLMGELSRDSAPMDAALRTFLKRPAPPNHYSQSWIDVVLGTVYWAQGKHEQALPMLNRGLLVGNQFDHPLTTWALIVLGRIALDAERPADAIKLFEEATFVAADYEDARGLEEAFRWACTAHLVAGSRGVPPSISGGAEWARGRLPVLHARLMAMQAECLAVAGEPAAAVKVLGGIDGRLLRGDPGRGLCGVEAAYAAAVAGYQAGDVATGDAELTRALAIARPRTPKLFQTAALMELLLAGSSSVSDRRANDLFEKLLGDPRPRDFTLDPVGTLAALSAPRAEAYEAWVAAAGRRGLETALFAAEATQRSRWLAAQPLGGRRAAIETLIGAAPESLAQADAARRAGLLARQPRLAATLDQMARVRTGLTAAANAAAAQPRAAAEVWGDVAAWKEYQRLAATRAQLVAAIAASREPTALDFPPLTPTAQIRGRLAPGHSLLSFHWTASGLTGVLETRERAAAWDVKQAGSLAKEIAGLVKALCLFDPIAAVATERLATTDWRPAAERVERLLFQDSKIDLGDAKIAELVIVPDGLLWYVPFELLPVGSVREPGAEPRMARDAYPIRYAPTRSLAVARFDPLRGSGATGIYVGRLFRGDKPEAAQRVIDRLAASLDRPLFLTPSSAPAPVPLVGSLLDSLVVFEELAGEGPIASRPLVQAAPGKPGMTFGEWTGSPRKRPQRMVLPGFQSAVAGGLAKMPARPGEDLFLATTDLLAAGSRTVLISRWRMGGKTSIDLVEEFLRDVVPTGEAETPPAAESWRRAVDVVTAEQPDPEQEPRVKQSPGAVLADARHPFFWAGYMLVDCGAGADAGADAAPAGQAGVVPPVAGVGPAQAVAPQPPAAMQIAQPPGQAAQ